MFLKSSEFIRSINFACNKMKSKWRCCSINEIPSVGFKTRINA